MLTQMTVLRSEKQEEWDRRELAQLKEELQVLHYMCVCSACYICVVSAVPHIFWCRRELAQLKEELQVLRCYMCRRCLLYMCRQYHIYSGAARSRRSCRYCVMYMCRQCLLYMCVGVPHMQAVYVSAVPHMQRRRREKQEERGTAESSRSCMTWYAKITRRCRTRRRRWTL